MSNLSLDERLHYIGVQLASGMSVAKISKKEWIDIEQTIVDAAYEIPNDSRMLSLLCSWFKVHGNYLIAEKIIKYAENEKVRRGANPWFNVLMVFAGEIVSYKYEKWAKKEKTPLYLQSKELSESAIKLKGAIPYFAKKNIFIPEGFIRIRESDALPPKQLAQCNLQYRNRYLYGPSWRADIITAIEYGIENPFKIAKLLGCSYEPANRVYREYRVASA